MYLESTFKSTSVEQSAVKYSKHIKTDLKTKGHAHGKFKSQRITMCFKAGLNSRQCRSKSNMQRQLVPQCEGYNCKDKILSVFFILILEQEGAAGQMT